MTDKNDVHWQTVKPCQEFTRGFVGFALVFAKI